MSSAAVKMTLGTFYLIGASLLLPGFIWIQPLEPLCLAIVVPGTGNATVVPCSDPHIVFNIPDGSGNPISFPHFKDGEHGAPDDYGAGVWCIVVGTFLFIVASLIDFVSALSTPHHVQKAEESQENAAATNDVGGAHGGSFAEAGQSLAEGGAAGGAGALIKKMLGPTLMVIGSCLIFFGAILFLPRFSMGGDQGKPLMFLGAQCPDVAILMFQIAAIVFLISAFTAIAGVSAGIVASRKAGRPTCVLWFSLLAFVCFIPCSCLYFGNSFIEDDIEAGHCRMAGTAFLAIACYILFAVTLYEVCLGPPAKKSGSASENLNTM